MMMMMLFYRLTLNSDDYTMGLSPRTLEKEYTNLTLSTFYLVG